MKKTYVDQKLCVVCGCCVTACKLGAINIPSGTHSEIDYTKCIGCGMCSLKCPASIITVKEVNSYAEEKMVLLPVDIFYYLFNPGII